MTYDLIGGDPSPDGLGGGDVTMVFWILEEDADGGECGRDEAPETLLDPDMFLGVKIGPVLSATKAETKKTG